MKIMICGKGGTGKSALTVMAARVLSKSYGAYVVDSDESNALLPRMLGVEPPKPLIEYLGGKGKMFKRSEVDIVKALTEAGQGIRLANLPTSYISSSPEGIKLVTIGKVREFGEGCACPFNFIAKVLLKNLLLKSDEIVLIDTDAGVEHVGRGVEEGCDTILTVADPTAESLELAKMLSRESAKMDKIFWLVINKVTSSIVDMVETKAKNMGLNTIGLIRFDDNVFRSCLEGGKLRAKDALLDVESILKSVKLIED